MTWGNYAWPRPAKADMPLQFFVIKAFFQRQEFFSIFLI